MAHSFRLKIISCTQECYPIFLNLLCHHLAIRTRLLEGYNRGLGPIDPYLKDWEDPVGVYTDTGDYYYFVFDIRKSRMVKKPTFRIGDRNFYYRINSYHTVAARVDPKTGNMIV